MKFQNLRGMNDILPAEVALHDKVLDIVKGILRTYNIKEIRTPVLENTELFKRSVGNVTDIVEKEMFSFSNRDGEQVTLRPEGTAGCMRAVISHNMVYNQEQRLFYFNQMFRYERPQKGRYRQFHQIGVEILGIKNYALDVEVLLLLRDVWAALGVENSVELQINNIGTSEDRKNFGVALVDFLKDNYDLLDHDSQKRLYNNPLRILDSKDSNTQKLLLEAPKLADYINEESKNYFTKILELLTTLGVNYKLNPNLVRGLDYYNDTVFEWVTTELGAQGTVCGGGRYDTLVETLGGNSTPGFGFGLGFERLLLLIKEVNPEFVSSIVDTLDVYIASKDIYKTKAMEIAIILRNLGLSVVVDHVGSALKKQMAKANKLNAKYAIIIDENEVVNSYYTIKNMELGTQAEVKAEDILTHFEVRE